MFSTLRNATHAYTPDFRRLWLSAALTNLGDGVLLSAGPLLVASLTRSPGAVGAAVFVQQLPWLLFGLTSGVLVDRLDRRTIVMVSDACRAAAVTALAVLVATHDASLVAVYVVLFTLGTGETLADNASSTLVVDTVDREQLGGANAHLGLTFTIGNQLAGPPLGALLFSLGMAAPFGVQALTLAAAATIVRRLQASRTATSGSAPSTVWADMAAGLRWLRHSPPVRMLLLSIFTMDVAFATAFATWVLYCTRLLGLADWQFGLLMTASAIGGLFGPWAFARTRRAIGLVGIVRAGFLVEAAVHLVLAATPAAWIVALTMLGFGVHTMVWGAAAVTIRQEATPPGFLGRVNSVYSVASIGGAALGSAIGATLAQTYSLTTGFWAAGTAMLLVAILAWHPLRAFAAATDQIPADGIEST